MTTNKGIRTASPKKKTTRRISTRDDAFAVPVTAVEYWIRLRLKDRERFDTVGCNEGEIIGVDVQTPLGIVELHHGGGIGPIHLAITMLDDMKVAEPIFDEKDFTCRKLDGDPICFGKWWPYSLYYDRADEFIEGKNPGMVRKGVNVWKLRCYAPDGTPASVPIPRGLVDDIFSCR